MCEIKFQWISIKWIYLYFFLVLMDLMPTVNYFRQFIAGLIVFIERMYAVILNDNSKIEFSL